MNYNKLIYSYGCWAMDMIPFRYDKPNTLEELFEDIKELYLFLRIDWDGTLKRNQDSFRPGVAPALFFGAEIYKLSNEGKINIPYPKPQSMHDLKENTVTLTRLYCDTASAELPVIEDKEYRYDELLEIGFPFRLFGEPQGSFVGTLVAKAYKEKYPMLDCFFVTDDGARYIVHVWADKNFSPKKFGPDFRTVSVGSRMECVIHISKSPAPSASDIWEAKFI